MADIAKLAGSRVFITGAASGIGYEMALAFARDGADVIATDLQQEGLDSLAASIRTSGGVCDTAILDVTDEAAFLALFEGLAAAGELPDIVINNAGIGFMGDFLSTDGDAWRRVLNINVMGVVNGCRAYLQSRSGGDAPGLLINVASAASFAPMPNMTAYGASKYAVDGLSEVLAMELRDGPVSVMTVHPGVINTRIVQHPELARVAPEQLGRLQAYYTEKGIAPAEVAAAVVDGVRRGCSHVYVGESVSITLLLKRLLSRARFRRLLTSTARKIGYL